MYDFNLPIGFYICYKFDFYEVVEGDDCRACAFYGNCPKEILGDCPGPYLSQGRPAIFVSVKRPESGILRAQRFEYANHCCEYCHKPISGMNAHWHHVIDRDYGRRDKYECFESTRALGHDCHEGKNKGTVLQFYRKEVDEWLLLQYSDDDTRTITGRGLHV
jgi:hypothetical protein